MLQVVTWDTALTFQLSMSGVGATVMLCDIDGFRRGGRVPHS